jgi:hypothetical protein
MERPVAFPIPRGFHSPMGARIVPLRVYDETIRVLKSAVQKARLGHAEEVSALQRLDQQARQLERCAQEPSFDALIDEEFRRSPSYGGRSAFGFEQPSPGIASTVRRKGSPRS